jgi:N-acetylglucosamine-6-phosphate deacetylase
VEEDGRLYFTDDGGLLGSGFFLDQCVSHMVCSRLADQKTAVEMGSRRPALYLGKAERLGTLEPGKEATFVLCRWNPDEGIRVEETWIRGKQVFKKIGSL